MNRHRLERPRNQKGVLLLEVLMAILIFSFGILGLIGLQTSSVKQSTDAKFRSDAGLMADELLGKMWVSDRTAATLQSNFSSPSGALYLSWLGDANTPGTVLSTLPGAASHFPDVSIDTSSGTSAVTVTLYWKAPYEADAAAEHKYTVRAQIK